MEEELEGTIRIENYFQQDAPAADTDSQGDGFEVQEREDEQSTALKHEGAGFEPHVLGSLAVVDSLTAGDDTWPQGKASSRGRPRGASRAAYEPNSQKRSNKQCSRKSGIVKKCSELAVITGGTVFFRFVTLEGKSYVYSSCDKLWEDYVQDGLQAGSKEIRIDENAKELTATDTEKGNMKEKGSSKDKEKTTEKGKGTEKGKPAEKRKSTDECSSENGVDEKQTENEPKPTPKEPKVIEIKPDDSDDAKNDDKEPPKAKKSSRGRPKKDPKKPEPQESVTIETQSTSFLNPSLQTLHIDKKFVISSPDVLSENSNSISYQAAPEESLQSGSTSVPVLLFPNQPTFQLDPSLVSNGAGSFPSLIPLTNNPKPNPNPKRKRKRQRSESPEPKKEKVDVKCGVCSELYAKRQDNRRYGRWIGCSDCPVWVHAKCVDWTEADIDSARDYYCEGCAKKKKEEEEKAAEAANAQEETDKEKEKKVGGEKKTLKGKGGEKNKKGSGSGSGSISDGTSKAASKSFSRQ